MTEEEYINSLEIIYKYLMKTLSTDKIGKISGYVSSALDVIEAIMRKKGN